MMPVPLVVRPPAELSVTKLRPPPGADNWPTLMSPLVLVDTLMAPPSMTVSVPAPTLPLKAFRSMLPRRPPTKALAWVSISPVVIPPLPLYSVTPASVEIPLSALPPLLLALVLIVPATSSSPPSWVEKRLLLASSWI